MAPERIGKYLIVRKAGRGGFGDVYEGWDPSLGRNVAIKVLKPRDDEDRRRFEREARVIAALGPQLPVVAQIYDFFSDPGRDLHFLVEEFLSGVDLKTKIEEGDRLPAELRLIYLDKVAYGLAEVHKRGVVHRDLKPGNVRVLHNHEIKLLDFGLAKVVGEDTLAENHGGVGTPSYAAPEQSLDIGGHDGGLVDARADVFSFGVIAYELLTVRRPYEAATWPEYFELLERTGPPPVNKYWPECPEDLNETIMSCMRRDPAKRPGIEAVRKVLRKSIRAARSLPMPPVARRHRRDDATPATVRGVRRSDVAASGESTDEGPSRGRGSALLNRAALLPWLIPTLILGVALGVAVGIAGRSLVGGEELAEMPTADAALFPEADPPADPPAPAPEIRFELSAARAGGSRPTVQLSGGPEGTVFGPDVVAYCQVERTPPWSLGDVEQPRKRRDDCWLGGVTYEDVDVERGESYSYEVRLHDASGRLLAMSDMASVEIGG